MPLEPGFGKAGLEQRLDEEPGAVVLAALPAPRPASSKLGHRLQALDQRLGRERIELLDAHDLDAEVAGLRRALPSARRRACPSTAPAAACRPRAGGLRSLRMRRKWLSPVKSATVRHRELVPEQRLGRHHDQRLAEIAQQLAPQDVEIIGRRGAIGDLEIVLGAQLQIALEPRRAMLRPLPFEAVRQQHARGRWRAATWPRPRR